MRLPMELTPEQIEIAENAKSRLNEVYTRIGNLIGDLDVQSEIIYEIQGDLAPLRIIFKEGNSDIERARRGPGINALNEVDDALVQVAYDLESASQTLNETPTDYEGTQISIIKLLDNVIADEYDDDE